MSFQSLREDEPGCRPSTLYARTPRLGLLTSQTSPDPRRAGPTGSSPARDEARGWSPVTTARSRATRLPAPRRPEPPHPDLPRTDTLIPDRPRPAPRVPTPPPPVPPKTEGASVLSQERTDGYERRPVQRSTRLARLRPDVFTRGSPFETRNALEKFRFQGLLPKWGFDYCDCEDGGVPAQVRI